MSNAIKNATWLELALYYLGQRKAFIVEGDSMLPTLKNGDKVLVDPKCSIAIGDIVLGKHPYKSNVKIIKRVTDIAKDGRLTLAGDNPAESTDSRTFGTVSGKYIIGTLTSKT